VNGRLDNYGSQPLEEALAEMIRDGVHHLRLDLSNVAYVSSAGIGVLMSAYRDIAELQGTFRISAASERVRTVLRLASLESVLFGDEPAAPAAPAVDAPDQIASKSALFDCYSLGDMRAEFTLFGDPSKISRSPYAASDVSQVRAGRDVFALGVGALGTDFGECRDLFGEFVSAAGVAAYTPTDGTSTADYMANSADLVAEIQAAYALVFRGAAGKLVRFEGSGAGVAVPLSEIVAACAGVAGTPQFGIVMAAEVAGLVCTALRRSPAKDLPARFDFPDVRDWLAFAAEHEHARTSCVVVGVVDGSPSERAAPFVRPVADGFSGHLHAAVTAFRSLARGRVNLGDAIAGLFQPRSLVAVVHLLRDDRPIEGAGESEFHRGACWVFPFAGEGAAQ
jgi:anti-sigma B factor antagonist